MYGMTAGMRRRSPSRQARSAGPLYPPALPPDGRVRIGIVSPCCFLGGADLWVSWLMDHCDPARVRFEGVAIVSDAIPPEPTMLADWEAHAPVRVGDDAIRELGRRVDVVIAWGVFMTWGMPGSRLASLLPPGLPAICVSHGSLGRAHAAGDDGFPGCVPAAVSRSALRGLPDALRASARIIPNAVSDDRVARTRTRADMLAEWGLPPDAKVVGWLARIASEKRPTVFIDAVAKLPPGWYGVMAGIGHMADEARAHADEHVPGRIVFLGGRHDVGDVLGGFDCFALPTESEACALAVIEAGKAGVPIITTLTGVAEEYPWLARIIPNPPTATDLAFAVLADDADRAGTTSRVEAVNRFMDVEMSMDRFGREWTDLACEVFGPVKMPKTRVAAKVQTTIDPAVRDAVNSCEHRGKGGPLTPLESEKLCCGGWIEKYPCSKNLGVIPGRVSLRECLDCKASEALATPTIPPATTPPTP
jgi:hypothetical protein